MSSVPVEETKSVLDATRYAQLLALVKDNQLVTALVLFALWQSGALLSAYGYVQGGMC